MSNSEYGLVERAAASPLGLALGLVADLAAVVTLLQVQAVAAWASANPTAMICIAALLLAVTLVCVNTAVKTSGKARKLQAALRETQKELRSALDSPTQTAERDLIVEKARKAQEQDRRKYEEFLQDFGRNSLLSEWLSGPYSYQVTHRRYLSEIDRLDRKWLDDPISYNNEKVDAAFNQLRDSVSELERVTVMHFYSYGDPEEDHFRIETGINGDDATYRRARREVLEAAEEVSSRRTSFLRAAHQAQLD